MPFPNTRGKHAYEAFFSPADYIAYLKEDGRWEDFSAPEGVLFVYSDWLLDRALARERSERRSPFAGELHLVQRDNGIFGVCGRFGIGAAIASTLMEELIAIGVRRFISIGSAGALQPALGIGEIVLCDRAIRDEGVSHHYLKSGKFVRTSKALTAKLGKELASMSTPVRHGATWTVDAPYRETVRELERYQAEGILTVEMEAAALAAVATFRGVDFAAAFTISDSLAELTWSPRFGSEETRHGLELLYEAATAALVQEPKPSPAP